MVWAALIPVAAQVLGGAMGGKEGGGGAGGAGGGGDIFSSLLGGLGGGGGGGGNPIASLLGGLLGGGATATKSGDKSSEIVDALAALRQEVRALKEEKSQG